MKRILFLMTALVLTFAVSAAIRVERRDLKLASQALLEYQRIPIPIVATTNRVVTTNAGPISAAAVSISTFANQPDVPRNLTITPTGTTADVEACVITVTGTNFYNQVITETFTFLANASTAVAGAKAFRSVTSVDFPASCESGTFAATWIVGVGDVLGLKNCLRQAGDVAWAVFNGAFEATRATCVADADEVEKNTCDINGTLDGAKNVDLYFVQNFACIGAQ